MTQQLDDWTGPRPWEVAPKTETALPRSTSDFAAPEVRMTAQRLSVDERARIVDPATFRQYDALAERVNTYRRWIDELADTRDAGIMSRLQDVDDRIYALEAKMQKQTGRRLAKSKRDLLALEAEKQRIVDESAGVESRDMARVRQALLKADEKMRDLAPAVSRAYARARDQWDASEEAVQAVMQAVREGRREIPLEVMPASKLQEVETALTDVAPVLREAENLDMRVTPSTTTADVALKATAEMAKVFDTALDDYRASLDGLIDLEKNGTMTVEGQDVTFNLDQDRIFVPNEEGTGGRDLTIRQVLEENRASEYELEAVSVCSTRRTS